MELDVYDVGPSLARATAVVTKNAPKNGGFGGNGGGNFGQQQSYNQEHQPTQPQSDPWAASNNSSPF